MKTVGFIQLAHAVCENDQKLVEEIAGDRSNGINVNQFIQSEFRIRTNDDLVLRGWNLLHVAVLYGYDEILETLIAYKANVNLHTETMWQEPPLGLTAYSSKGATVETLKLLVNHKADVNRQDKGLDTPLYTAIKHRHKNKALALIEANADCTIQNKDGKLPIREAARKGLTEVETMLDDITLKETSGELTLHEAARIGRLEIVEKLSKTTKLSEKHEGLTPLHWAALRGHLEIVEILVSNRADICAKSLWENTPLHWAALRGHTTVVQFLIANSADVCAEGEEARTPLHWATSRGNDGIVDILISSNADLSIEDRLHMTPLHNASRKGHTSTVELLISHNADILYGDSTASPLHIAARCGHSEVVLLLIEKRADMSCRNKSGGTPLHEAAKHGHKHIVDVLISQNASLSVPNQNGDTPLRWAAKLGFVDVVKTLVLSKADIAASDKWQSTPLHTASKHGCLNIVKFLIATKAEVSARDFSGVNTPLHMAVMKNHPEIVQVLVQNNADLFARNKIGKTPYALARSSKFNECVQILQKGKKKADSSRHDRHDQNNDASVKKDPSSRFGASLDDRHDRHDGAAKHNSSRFGSRGIATYPQRPQSGKDDPTRQRPKLNLKPRSSKAGNSPPLVPVRGKNNPFGAAKPREENLEARRKLQE